jgi:hypothetical protein
MLAAVAGEASAQPVGAHPASDPVLGAIQAARASGGINAGRAATYTGTYLNALHVDARLSGVRAKQLGSAISIVQGIAARGTLIASRMRAVFLTLHRNVRWWGSHGPPTAGSGGEPTVGRRQCNPPLPSARDAASRMRAVGPPARAANVAFGGVVFEYYPGLGLQLQVNATFSAAESMLQYGSPRQAQQGGTILEQMLPLASRRAGLLTWEYEFPFEGVEPPWTSGLSQATAIDAFVRAAKRLRRAHFLKVALRLARLFTASPPVGVRVQLAHGPWFLLYSFDPGQLVLNADLDSLIALHELRVATRSPWVAALAHDGLHSLERYLPQFDTGSWSYYSLGGPLTDLNYHILNQELSQELCQETGVKEICRTASSFNRELNARCPIVKHNGDPGGFGGRGMVGRGQRPASMASEL